MEARKAEQKQLLETLQATHKAVKEAEAGVFVRVVCLPCSHKRPPSCISGLLY
jgi:hypothetical protein